MKEKVKQIPLWAWIAFGLLIVFFVLGLILVLRLTLSTGNSSASNEALPSLDDTKTAVDDSVLLPTPTQQQQSFQTSKAQGEGCNWDTCAWMKEEQCEQCGGTWQDYGLESYCDCSANRWEAESLQWCNYEGGTWLVEEDRCTFSSSIRNLAPSAGVSACSDLFFLEETGRENNSQAFLQECKQAGGVQQCWDEECRLALCVCPDADHVSGSCDWVAGREVETDLRCYEENDTCWLTITPADAIRGLDGLSSLPEVVLTSSTGQVFTSNRAEENLGGCIQGLNQISCLVSDGETFDPASIEHIYLCKDMCCLDLATLVTSDIRVQAGDCPGGGNLEIKNFSITKGELTLDVLNDLGWKVHALDAFLNDAKDARWTTLKCTLDEVNHEIMHCKGWAVYKSGYATLNFYFGSGTTACSVTNFRFTIPELSKCSYDQNYCSHTGDCCSSGYTCCVCGCKKLKTGQTCTDACN